MTRNTFFAAMMFAMMAMVSNNMMAQGHGHNDDRGYSFEVGTRGAGYNSNRNNSYSDNRNNSYNSNRNYNSNYNENRNYNDNRNYGYSDNRNYGYDRHDNYGHRDEHRHDYGRGNHGYREMHGHRWDHDGWMVGYHGRVRHFDDGRWGYLRDGRWYYYNCFFEPDYYYARPVAHFHSHIMTPTERRVVGATVGAVAVAALISALAN